MYAMLQLQYVQRHNIKSITNFLHDHYAISRANQTMPVPKAYMCGASWVMWPQCGAFLGHLCV